MNGGTGPQPVTDAQRQAAATIDARVRQLRRQGSDDIALFVQMAEGEEMARFKGLLDTTTAAGLDALCAQFSGFQYYARLLERIAGGIASGEIPVPA